MARHVRMSPQKVAAGDRSDPRTARRRCAADRCGSPRSAPRSDIEKVLRSAIANAERKAEDAGASLDVDELFVSKCFVNEGARWKRLRPAPMGRAFRYQKRTAHICGRRCRASCGRRRTRCRREPKRKRRRAFAAPRRRVRKALTGKKEAGSKEERRSSGQGGSTRQTMGQKTHPYGFRLGYNKPWKSRWYADREYADLLHEDVKLRKELKERLKSAGISSIDIERAANKLVVRIYTARPGIIIGRKGAEIDKLKQEVQKRTKREVHIDIQEVHRPELDATLVAESIALQLEKRVAFRRAMRKAVDSALRFGCKGIKVRVAGRLNGAEIARKEWYLQGRLPLQTLRADIDFGTAEAHTTYGVIGVKCWIYQGENVPKRGSKIQRAARSA